jgi:RNA polymerase sigma-70 factor, ECF subfamily
MKPPAAAEPSAEELLARIAARDEAALGELYDRCAPGLLGMLMRILSDRAAAEEVLEDVFARLWSEARRLSREGSSVGARLFFLARRRAIERLRAARRLPALTFSVPERTTLAWLPQPKEIALVDQRRELLRKVINQLPKPQREALEGVIFEGYTAAELAHRLDEPRARVRAGLQAAMRFLRHRLAAVLGTWAANI